MNQFLSLVTTTILSLLLLLLLSPQIVRGQKCDSNGLCDKHERCSAWKEEGECLQNKV